MPSFVLVVDSTNIGDRIEGLAGILGPRAGGTSSNVLQKKDFHSGSAAYPTTNLTGPKTELTITHSFTKGSLPADFLTKLHSIFPELQFKSEFLEKFKIAAGFYKYVNCRGFLSVSREGVFPQDVEFSLADTLLADEVVIAQDSLDSTRKQIVFARFWESSNFISEILEKWIVSERVRLVEECDEVDIALFSGPSEHALSESRQGWPGLTLPSLIFSKEWPNRKQEYPNSKWVVIASRMSYADISHAFAVLMGKSKEYIRYNCIFCLPDHRGRITGITIEPTQSGYDLVVSCDVASTVELKIKASYVLEAVRKFSLCS